MKTIAILIHLIPTIFLVYPFMAVQPANVQVSGDPVIEKPLVVETVVTQPDQPTIDMSIGFRSIYIEAATKYGIPWQLLEAVHYIETGKDGDTHKESYAGAQGPMQFMPATWEHYQEDGDGDGVASMYDVHDAIYGAAKLLAAGGADRGQVREALFNYNHSWFYVDQQVLPIAYELGYKP